MRPAGDPELVAAAALAMTRAGEELAEIRDRTDDAVRTILSSRREEPAGVFLLAWSGTVRDFDLTAGPICEIGVVLDGLAAALRDAHGRYRAALREAEAHGLSVDGEGNLDHGQVGPGAERAAFRFTLLAGRAVAEALLANERAAAELAAIAGLESATRVVGALHDVRKHAERVRNRRPNGDPQPLHH